MLLLRILGRVVSVHLNRVVEGLEPLEKVVAIEGTAGQFSNDLFNFGGDHVALAELRVVEDPAEDAFGEQVLHQHALDRIFRKIGIDGLLAERVEIGEGSGRTRGSSGVLL
jgi:hypothetical protein